MNHVIRNIPRADAAVVDGLKTAGSAMVCEAMGRDNLLPASLKPVLEGAAIAGSAITISVPRGDHYMVHVAIELAASGDVLVVVPQEPDQNAYFGEMMAVSAKAFGVAGLIIDAGIRDVAAIRDMAFPVWASAVCAAGTDRNVLGQVNHPVVCGGVNIVPGDIIVADDDGVCCVPRLQAAEILARAEAKVSRETEIRQSLSAKISGLDVYDLRGELERLGIRYVDQV